MSQPTRTTGSLCSPVRVLWLGPQRRKHARNKNDRDNNSGTHSSARKFVKETVYVANKSRSGRSSIWKNLAILSQRKWIVAVQISQWLVPGLQVRVYTVKINNVVYLLHKTCIHWDKQAHESSYFVCKHAMWHAVHMLPNTIMLNLSPQLLHFL